jgi:hypothetical protein
MQCVFNDEYQNIPELTKAGITRYVEHRCKPGSFLSALICGDLYTAMRRADSENRKHLVLIAPFLNDIDAGWNLKKIANLVEVHQEEL